MDEYEKKDLEDFADIDEMGQFDYADSWVSISRREVLSATLGIDNDDIDSINHGSYQGTLLFIFEKGGYLWLLKDAYGSCSHCDGLLACSVESDFRDYALSMFRNAYAFKDTESAIAFLEEKQENGTTYGWGGVASKGLESLK